VIQIVVWVWLDMFEDHILDNMRKEDNSKKTLVVSAVNLIEGGTLTIMRECLKIAVADLGDEWDIVALVHDKKLIDLPTVQCIEFPKAKRSWFLRLYYELYIFKSLSKRLAPDLWLSLHDITPNVCARRQAVYCHNPSPFYRQTFRESILDPTFFLFSKMYSFVYKTNIQRNHHVVVQQKWLREEFKRRYGARNVVVAHPIDSVSSSGARERRRGDTTIFFFPSLSRFFKNFEVICAAAELLAAEGVSQFEVRLTIDGTENRYSAGLLKRYGALGALRFIGRQNQIQMSVQYEAADCLIFPSRLETWGLPITEARALGMPMLVADVPYAHETVGTYDQVRFFPATDAIALAALMRDFIAGRLRFDHVVVPEPAAPFAKNWSDLLKILTTGL